MIDVVPRTLQPGVRRHLSGVIRPEPIVLFLTTAALFLSHAMPARSANDEVICEMTPEGFVKCRKPDRIGGDPTPLNKDDLPDWLKGKASLDAVTKVQAK